MARAARSGSAAPESRRASPRSALSTSTKASPAAFSRHSRGRTAPPSTSRTRPWTSRATRPPRAATAAMKPNAMSAPLSGPRQKSLASMSPRSGAANGGAIEVTRWVRRSRSGPA